MARKKTREEDYIDGLETKVRELKSLVRSLTKRLKKVSRGYYKFLDHQEEDNYTSEETQNEIIKAKKELKKVCFECGIGEYRLIIIYNRRFRLCQHCGKKGKVTYLDKNGNEIK